MFVPFLTVKNFFVWFIIVCGIALWTFAIFAKKNIWYLYQNRNYSLETMYLSYVAFGGYSPNINQLFVYILALIPLVDIQSTLPTPNKLPLNDRLPRKNRAS